jgi:hypothetical protein
MKKLLLLVLFVALIAAGLTLPVYAQLPPGYPIDEGYPVDTPTFVINQEACEYYASLGYEIAECDGLLVAKDRGSDVVGISIGEAQLANVEPVTVNADPAPDVKAGGEGPVSAIVIVGFTLALLGCCALVLKRK